MNLPPRNASADRLSYISPAGLQTPSVQGHNNITISPAGQSLPIDTAEASKITLPHSSKNVVVASAASAPTQAKILDVPPPNQSEGKVLSDETCDLSSSLVSKATNSSFSPSASQASKPTKAIKSLLQETTAQEASTELARGESPANAPSINDEDVDEDDDDFKSSFITCSTSTEYAGRTNFNEDSNRCRKSHEMGAISFALTLDLDDLYTDSDDEESVILPSQ